MLTETTAEIAAALTFAAARRVVEADRFMRGGHYKGWLPTLFIGNLLQNKTVRVLWRVLWSGLRAKWCEWHGTWRRVYRRVRAGFVF